MSEPQEFDYEVVLKSCSMQDVALKQSFKQRQEVQEKYEETSEAYKKAKQECLKTEDQNLIRQEMSNDSDDFTNEISNLLEKFQNLGNEFDEAAVLKNQSDYIHEIEVLKSELKEKKNYYDQIKHYQMNYNAAIRSMELALGFYLNNFNPFQLRADILEKKQNLQHLEKNIDFLKNRNHELKIQYDTFH